MKKYVITSEICHMPVVDMATGRVIANSFVPYYDKNTLALKYLALTFNDTVTDDNTYVPFSSLCFINAVCTMISIPKTHYVPDKENSIRLIGEPLTANAGAISVFKFGSIAQTDISETGEILSFTLSDGHSFLVPQEGAPENAAVNEAFASEVFHTMSESKMTSEPVTDSAFEERRDASDERSARPLKKSVTKQADVVKEPIVKTGKIWNKKSVKTGQETQNPVSEVQPPVGFDEKEDAAGGKVRTAGKKKGRFHKYVAPIIAMIVFFVLYCLMQYFFIHSNATWW